MARSWWSSVLSIIMECKKKLSVEEVDGRAGGGGHLSALAVLRAVPLSSNDNLVGVEGAAKALADIMIINYCVEANANAFYVPCAVRSKQKPMLHLKKMVATDNQWLSGKRHLLVWLWKHTAMPMPSGKRTHFRTLQSSQKVPIACGRFSCHYDSKRALARKKKRGGAQDPSSFFILMTTLFGKEASLRELHIH